MPNSLNNKVAIITGASRGIGAAIAERFAAEGAKVVLVARTSEPDGKLPGSLNETAARIRAKDGDCLCVQADLGSETDRERIVNETIAYYGGVDIPAPAPYDPNDRAYRFHTTHSPTLYGSTKAALERMSTGMAMEVAADNVAVNTLAPVEAVASEGALKSGSIDDIAHMEPIEAMAEAALALCSRPQDRLSGRIALSLPLLRELDVTVMGLDGTSPLPDFRL